ncbi:metallophosphoesterase [Alkalibacterium psychrotolerans]
MKRFKLVRLLLLLLFTMLIAAYLVWQNNAIQVTHYDFNHTDIPEAFDGYTIVQVSDLHNKDFGNQLTDKVREQNPDLIAVTGDVIDSNRTDIPVAIEALTELVEMAPVYFVSGNHEIASEQYPELQVEMEAIGVINLDNSSLLLEREGTEIGLIGLEDPLLVTREEIEMAGSQEQFLQDSLVGLTNQVGTDFNLLLSHRAEVMELYARTDVDLALTGHAHGGQIRVPGVNGLYAPTQGFFPEYTSGLYEEGDTQMIVSRGLGNSLFPFRVNNRPELIVVTLESE